MSLLRLERLQGVHPELVGVIQLAAQNCPCDLIVLEGGRTKDRQAKLKKAGASKTMNSRHLMQACGFFCAVDVAPVLDTDGDGDKEASWHWPHYHEIAKYIKAAAAKLRVRIVWGGDWRSFPDGPHWELSTREYP